MPKTNQTTIVLAAISSALFIGRTRGPFPSLRPAAMIKMTAMIMSKVRTLIGKGSKRAVWHHASGAYICSA